MYVQSFLVEYLHWQQIPAADEVNINNSLYYQATGGCSWLLTEAYKKVCSDNEQKLKKEKRQVCKMLLMKGSTL